MPGALSEGPATFADMETEVAVDDSRSRELPEVWSPSSLNTFLKCPLSYWFTYAQGWRSVPNAAMEAGTLVHAVLERLLALEPADRTRETARDLYTEEAQARIVDLPASVDRDDLRARAGTALNSYFALEDPQRIDLVPDGLERRVATLIEGVPIAGVVDRLEFAAGGARVLDYKTGGAKPRYAADYWRQLLLYARMLSDEGTDVGEVALLFLGQPARLMVRPTPQSALARAGGDLVRAAAEREQFEEAGEWRAITGPLCSHCPFVTVCPAQQFSPDHPAPIPGGEQSTAVLERSPKVLRRSPAVVPDEDSDAIVEESE